MAFDNFRGVDQKFIGFDRFDKEVVAAGCYAIKLHIAIYYQQIKVGIRVILLLEANWVFITIFHGDFLIWQIYNHNLITKEWGQVEMSRILKKEAEGGLFKGQKYHYEGYPQWYNDQLSKNKPISIDLFSDQLESAAFFYQKQASKFHFANNVLNIQLSAVNREIDELEMMIAQVQQNQNSSAEDKKKRIRRCANQIQRKYVCPVANCEKSYGTEGSMAQHMRLKHPGVNYVMAELNPEPAKFEEKDVKLQEKVKREHRRN